MYGRPSSIFLVTCQTTSILCAIFFSPVFSSKYPVSWIPRSHVNAHGGILSLRTWCKGPLRRYANRTHFASPFKVTRGWLVAREYQQSSTCAPRDAVCTGTSETAR